MAAQDTEAALTVGETRAVLVPLRHEGRLERPSCPVRNRIPPDAFDYYHGLGAARTYAAVARQFGVSVRGVTKRAVKEDWQGRLQRIESEARHKQDEKAIEDVSAVDERHLELSRAIQARALEALKSMPINSGMAAVRALDVSVKLERAILGRGKETAAGAVGSHSQLAEAAGAVPPEVVQAGLDAMRKAMAAIKPAAVAPPAPLSPPPVAPIPAPLPGIPGGRLRMEPAEN